MDRAPRPRQPSQQLAKIFERIRRVNGSRIAGTPPPAKPHERGTNRPAHESHPGLCKPDAPGEGDEKLATALQQAEIDR
eukprot:scaffold6068_cov119-Isochrysis_galbana.AAC.26